MPSKKEASLDFAKKLFCGIKGDENTSPKNYYISVSKTEIWQFEEDEGEQSNGDYDSWC